MNVFIFYVICLAQKFYILSLLPDRNFNLEITNLRSELTQSRSEIPVKSAIQAEIGTKTSNPGTGTGIHRDAGHLWLLLRL